MVSASGTAIMLENSQRQKEAEARTQEAKIEEAKKTFVFGKFQ